MELNWFVYDPSWMLHLSEFVWTLRSLYGRSSALVVFNNFILRRKNRFFIALSPFHFSRTLPLTWWDKWFNTVYLVQLLSRFIKSSSCINKRKQILLSLLFYSFILLLKKEDMTPKTINHCGALFEIFHFLKS